MLSLFLSDKHIPLTFSFPKVFFVFFFCLIQGAHVTPSHMLQNLNQKLFPCLCMPLSLIPLHLLSWPRNHLKQLVTLPETLLCHSGGWMHETPCRFEMKDSVEHKGRHNVDSVCEIYNKVHIYHKKKEDI